MKYTHKDFGIMAGNVITFTNSVGYKVRILVTRVEEKSWYGTNGNRNSYGTLKSYTKYPDFNIEK
jgi:hypothetical protein